MTVSPWLTFEKLKDLQDQIDNAPAGGEDYVAINSTGNLAIATGSDAIAIGEDAQALDLRSIAIGRAAVADGNWNIVIGAGSSTGSLVDDSVLIGRDVTSVSADGAVAIGRGAVVADTAVSIGFTPNASGLRSIAVGNNADANATDSISIGTNSEADQTNNIAIGNTAFVDAATGGVGIGNSVNVTGGNAVGLGPNAQASGPSSVAVGPSAISSGSNTYQFGPGTNSTASTMQFLSNTFVSGTGVLAGPASGVPTGGAYTYEMRFDASTNTLYIYNGSAWVSTVLTP